MPWFKESQWHLLNQIGISSMCKFMSLIRLIILSLFVFNQSQADTIYNLIKIPNLEIYDIKTPNKLRYLYAKQPEFAHWHTIGHRIFTDLTEKSET